MKCEPGLVYNNCGTERTCSSAFVDASKCVAGCFCPNGMVNHKGNCIQLSQCPCTRNGVEYPAGSESIYTSQFAITIRSLWLAIYPFYNLKKNLSGIRSTVATVCQCINGQINCGFQNYERRLCTIWVDSHVQSIYGNMFDFKGSGTFRYIGLDSLQIDGTRVPCQRKFVQCEYIQSEYNYVISQCVTIRVFIADGRVCTDSISINVKVNNTATNIKLMKNLYATVNGQGIHYYPVHLLNGYVEIGKPSGKQIVVTIELGFRVYWNGVSQVNIEAPSILHHKMDGLCLSKYSRRRRSTDEDDEIAWLSSIAETPCIGENCQTVKPSIHVPHACDSNEEAKIRAERVCAKVKGGIFETCHDIVEAEPYYENCMIDVCTCDRDIDSCMCDAFAAYANECIQNDIAIYGWRQSIQECGKFLFYFSFLCFMKRRSKLK